MERDYLKNKIKTVKDSFKSFRDGKSKFIVALEIITFILFAASIFSIPVCSFSSKFNIITWILTIGFVLGMMTLCLIKYGWKIDIVAYSLILFAISSFISTAINGFVSFRITAIALSLLSAMIYIYLKGSNQISIFIRLVYIGLVLFLCVFIVRYFRDLIGLHFDRLGSLFGDINDISLFLGLGSLFSFYFVLFKKGIILKIICGLLGLAFLYCGVATGSKIFILILLICFIVMLYIFFGKKKWWLSTVIVVGFLLVSSLLLAFVPILAPIKIRLIAFINQLFGLSIGNVRYVDYSTLDRLTMFKNGMMMFMKKPLFGWGIWGYASFNGLTNSWSHNNISESLCNFGLVGTVLFHSGYYFSFVGYGKSKHTDNKLMLLVVVFFLVSMLSVALNSEKIYAYIIPLAFACLSNVSLGALSIRSIQLSRPKKAS